MSLKTDNKYTKEDVQKAIEIIGSECFGALQMCNAIGGRRTPEWELVHNNTWAEVVAEGKSIGLDFDTMKCAVTHTPLMWSGYIQEALGLITSNERHSMFYKYVKNSDDGAWPDPSIKTPV